MCDISERAAGDSARLPEGDGLGPGLQGGGLGDGALELIPVDGAVVVRIHLAPHRRGEGNRSDPVHEKMAMERAKDEGWHSSSKSYLSIHFFELVVVADRDFE
jgi:hypothetical protein